jgi:V/A-type H+-transporting ATPase subunit A
VVGAFLGLSRARSDARRYPAIDPLISWSKYVDAVGGELGQRVEGWDKMVKKASKILREGDEIGKRMEVVGEAGISLHDMLTYLKSELYEFCYLQQNAFDKEDTYCPLDRQIPLFKLVNRIFEMPLGFDNHDQARTFFLELQNEIKNTNFMPFKSEHYRNTFVDVEKRIEAVKRRDHEKNL